MDAAAGEREVNVIAKTVDLARLSNRLSEAAVDLAFDPVEALALRHSRGYSMNASDMTRF